MRVKRLLSLLYNNGQQPILKSYFLLLVAEHQLHNNVTVNDGSISISFFFSNIELARATFFFYCVKRNVVALWGIYSIISVWKLTTWQNNKQGMVNNRRYGGINDFVVLWYLFSNSIYFVRRMIKTLDDLSSKGTRLAHDICLGNATRLEGKGHFYNCSIKSIRPYHRFRRHLDG